MVISANKTEVCEECLQPRETILACAWCGSKLCSDCLSPEEIVEDCCRFCRAREETPVMQFSFEGTN